MVEKMRAPVEGTLLALWGIEHFFSAEVVEQVVLSITWEESDGPSAFAVNEGPQKEYVFLRPLITPLMISSFQCSGTRSRVKNWGYKCYDSTLTREREY